MAITHPIAQPELHGDFRLRHVLGRTGEGGIILGTGIPESAVIEFTELDFDELLASGAGSVHAAIGALGGADPSAALIFDCAGEARAARGGPAGGRGDHRSPSAAPHRRLWASTRMVRWRDSAVPRETATMPLSRLPSAERDLETSHSERGHGRALPEAGLRRGRPAGRDHRPRQRRPQRG